MSGGDLVVAAAAGLAGAVALAVPRRVIAWKQRRHAHRRVARRQRGADQWFEESRTLAAYPPPSDPARVRWAGAGLLTLGLVLAYLSVHP